jgi:hypothetical protein
VEAELPVDVRQHARQARRRLRQRIAGLVHVFEPLACVGAEAVEPVDEVSHVEARVFVFGNEQGRLRQIQFRFRSRGHVRKEGELRAGHDL